MSWTNATSIIYGFKVSKRAYIKALNKYYENPSLYSEDCESYFIEQDPIMSDSPHFFGAEIFQIDEYSIPMRLPEITVSDEIRTKVNEDFKKLFIDENTDYYTYDNILLADNTLPDIWIMSRYI